VDIDILPTFCPPQREKPKRRVWDSINSFETCRVVTGEPPTPLPITVKTIPQVKRGAAGGKNSHWPVVYTASPAGVTD